MAMNEERDENVGLIDRIACFLKAHHPLDLLMPVRGPNNYGKPTKQPLRAHVDDVWSWSGFDKFRRLNTTHTDYAILCKTICVVDIDDPSIDVLVNHPARLRAPMETTKKGWHEFYLRSHLCEEGEFVDGANQIIQHVDFKSRCGTGTGGVIVIGPASGKVWVRSLMDYPLEPIPDELLIQVAKRKCPSKTLNVPDAVPTVPTAGVAARAPKSTDNQDGRAGECEGAVPFAKLQLVVNHLARVRSVSRSEWLSVLFAIGHVSKVNHYVESGRQLAHEFSKRELSKYDERTVDDIMSGAQGRSDSDVAFRMGSLVKWLQDDIGESRANALMHHWGAGMRVDNVSKYSFVEDTESHVTTISSPNKSNARRESHIQFMEYLINKWPACFASLDAEKFHVVDCNGGWVFGDGRIRGVVKNYNVSLEDGTFIGMLCGVVPVDGLITVHGICPLHKSWTAESQSASISVIKSVADSMGRMKLPTTINIESGAVEVMVEGKGTEIVTNPKKVGTLSEMIRKATQAHVEATLESYCFGNIFLVNNGTIIVNTPANKQDAFGVVRDKLMNFAKEHCLRKKDGNIYDPVAGCPCAYVIRCDYETFISSVLKGDAVFEGNVKRFDELLKFVRVYHKDELPELISDIGLLSFANGVLKLVDGVFVPYSDMSDGCDLLKQVARNHIPQVYTGSLLTPRLDVILSAQFDSEVACVLCALIGRSLFPVNLLDQWQVMLFMVGVGGTGKSVIMKIAQQMFAPGAIGNLAAQQEVVFGLESLLDKEVVFGRDMPAKMSSSLSQDNMQMMTAGEMMGVARKGKSAVQVPWTSTLIMAGNHMPDYQNTGDNVGRRVVTIRFDNIIKVPQQDLLQLVLAEELPNFICRCLTAYKGLRERVVQVGGFWDAVPKIMLEWKGEFSAATNKLQEFLSADEKGCVLARDETSITLLEDFKSAFISRMSKEGREEKLVLDRAVLSSFGYELSGKGNNRPSTCKSCKQLAKVGCCMRYSAENRIPKQVIFNMRLENYMVTNKDLTPRLEVPHYELVHLLNPTEVEYDTTSSIAETLFKEHVERYTGLSFSKVRCAGILSKSGNPLELDMYHVSEKLAVAVEYNGYQHYKFPNRFHSTEDEFTKVKLHDKIKVDRCKSLHLPLIVIRGSNIDDEMSDFVYAWNALNASNMPGPRAD